MLNSLRALTAAGCTANATLEFITKFQSLEACLAEAKTSVTRRRKYYDILLFDAVIVMKLFSKQLRYQAHPFFN